ncbi:hypothetical protein HBI84_187900 [Parastagonospora nodorum]|nr:hypothetical protein HBI84_187900 [Parastagonospora nodorum]
MRAWISLISLDSPFRVRIKTTRTHRHERQVTHYGIMRLINMHTLTLEEFIGRRIPRYAILSHTWEEEEVSYEEYIRGVHTRKKGYSKIQKTCCLAAAEGIGYAWVDTCCIDKRSSAELTEAINSMYLWYKCSAVCYAYLSDLPRNARLDKHLQKCRW